MEEKITNKQSVLDNDEKKNKKTIYSQLDYSITDPQQRNKRVHEILNDIPSEKLTPYYLEQLTKYLTETPENKKEKKILTENRMVTVNKRETSYEGFIDKLENGEDGIYNFMTDGDKNILLVPKIQITEDDILTIPGLKELRENIEKIENKQKIAKGKQKFLLTKQLIEMRQDQYVLKNFYKPPTVMTKIIKTINQIDLNENITINKDGEPESNCLVSFFNPYHVCCFLCNYSELKQEYEQCFNNDWKYLLQDFDNLTKRALKENYPVLYDIMIDKINGVQGKDIVTHIEEKYKIKYSVEYISTIWRKKIPKIISDKAKEEWIIWYYTYKKKGKWKRCSRCHQIKLAHPYFFTRNKTAKDGWYSMCKECRNKKK